MTDVEMNRIRPGQHTVELNPMQNDHETTRSSMVEALAEEPRGPEGRQSFSGLLKIIEKSTSQIFYRGPSRVDSINEWFFDFSKRHRDSTLEYLNREHYDVYQKFFYCWIFALIPYILARVGMFIVLVAFWSVFSVWMVIQIFIMMLLYSPMCLIGYNYYDFVCYVYYKMFVVGITTTFELTESFAKKNKFYYEDIKHFQWNWKCYGKILRRYRSITLLFVIIFLPITAYEATPQLQFRYDGGYLFGEYYNEVASAVLFLFGFGEWYDLLFNRREDLDILIESFLSNAKVLNNDFVDNVSYIQVRDFIAKEGFVLLQTDDKRVKVLLHELHPKAFHLLMEEKSECQDDSYEANKVYEIESYLKIQIREGQVRHGDHIVIVNSKYSASDAESQIHPLHVGHPSSASAIGSDGEEKKEEVEAENEGQKFRVIVQTTVVNPWTFTAGLMKVKVLKDGRYEPRYPTMLSRINEAVNIWLGKLWLTEAQVRFLRLLIIIFTIFYAIDELQDCRVIPTTKTKYLLITFLGLFFLLVLIYSYYNTFTSFHTFLFDEKTGDVIKIFNNRYIQRENERKFNINALASVTKLDQKILDTVVLSVRSSVNYNPYEVKRYRLSDTPQVLSRIMCEPGLSVGQRCCLPYEKGGFRFSDIINILERLCTAPGSTLSLEVRVSLFKRHNNKGECFEIFHDNEHIEANPSTPTSGGGVSVGHVVGSFDSNIFHTVISDKSTSSSSHHKLFVDINIERREMRIAGKKKHLKKVQTPTQPTGTQQNQQQQSSDSVKKFEDFFEPLSYDCERIPLKKFVTKILNDEQVIARKIISYIIPIKDSERSKSVVERAATVTPDDNAEDFGVIDPNEDPWL